MVWKAMTDHLSLQSIENVSDHALHYCSEKTGVRRKKGVLRLGSPLGRV